MSTRALVYFILLFGVSCVSIARYKNLSRPFKILACCVVVLFFTFLLDRYFIMRFHTNSPVHHFQSLEEYVFYSAIFYFTFKNAAIKKVIITSVVVLVIFFPINAIFLQPLFTTFPTNIDTPAQILFALYSLMLFQEMMDYQVKIDIVKQSVFWFNIAILFYATTSFGLLALTNYISRVSFKENKMIYYVWWAIDYLFLIFICVALVTRNKQDNAAGKQ